MVAGRMEPKPLQPWSGFESLVDGLVVLQARAKEAATRSVDEILAAR